MPPIPASAATVNADTPIAVKVTYGGEHRRFRLPLRDLGAHVFPQRIRSLLDIHPETNIILERYSDSAGGYVVLDSEKPSVYKQLYRAGKAKLKLRIVVTVADQASTTAYDDPYDNTPEEMARQEYSSASSREQLNRPNSYLDTVLQQPAMPAPDYGTLMDQISKESPAAQDDITLQPFELANKPKETLQHAALFPFSKVVYIDCNACGASIPNEHYHCSICEGGDYDLCQKCVDSGVSCPGDFHWLIKRSVDGGNVINSTSEILPPKPPQLVSDDQEVTETKDEPKEEAKDEPFVGQRTCNSCVRDLAETEMASCNVCFDHDICYNCLLSNTHGHNPAHSLSPVTQGDQDVWDMALVNEKSKPGRFYAHCAICDKCDKAIYGVRHKCLDCPDWDFCQDCVKDAPGIHPGHRFVPIYDHITLECVRAETHSGVFCDGPLCSSEMGRSYISGARYKCVVCDDLDFCANCEAHPGNTHNRTHPLLKFKTPVRHASISTYGVDGNGETLSKMGDRNVATSPSTETIAPSNTNASTQVHDDTPKTELAVDTPTTEAEEKKEEENMTASNELSATEGLNAHFVSDTIPDGTALTPNTEFTQIWTLHNPGPATWPKGCSVRFVGGDGMFNVDATHPMSVDTLVVAMESQENTEPVLPGSSVDFAITLKCPQRLGKAISYWRLKSPDNVPFGHRLWCDIEVQESLAQPEPQASEDNNKPEENEKNEAEASPDGESETKTEESLAESNMVFPKLEKESPDSSQHEETKPLARGLGRNEFEFIAEDLESLTIGVESDDGFFTDEEYDILDASDQEIVDESGNPSQKK